MSDDEFKAFIKEKGRELFRDMPWREDTRPYFVLVSELMLQQTQVGRVIPKFTDFIASFPDVSALASAPLSEVVRQWQGLGYNRRAKYLHDAAKKITEHHGGTFPEEPEELLKLPGIGKNTMGAIRAYAFNKPEIFIETNIRTVYIHHFFADHPTVTDTAISKKLNETLDHTNTREFYWALMDYGSWLKANGLRNNAKSAQYKKQSMLTGSVREMRGLIVRELTTDAISAVNNKHINDERYKAALSGLMRDGLVSTDGTSLWLTK